MLEVKLFKSIGALNKINRTSPKNALRTHHYTVVHPYLLHGLVL